MQNLIAMARANIFLNKREQCHSSPIRGYKFHLECFTIHISMNNGPDIALLQSRLCDVMGQYNGIKFLVPS